MGLKESHISRVFIKRFGRTITKISVVTGFMEMKSRKCNYGKGGDWFYSEGKLA